MKKGTDIDLHIDSMAVPEGITLRSDCPICGHSNSFSVTNNGDTYLYNCFYADCSSSGKVKKELRLPKLHDKKKALNFSIEASCFTPLAREPRALDYIRNNNIEHAYRKRYANLQYDVKEDRVVFCVYDNKLTIIDAVGRSLSNRKPKWKRYSSARVPFITRNKSDICVVVEDCASACAVTQAEVVGVSLMGTNLLQEHVSYVRKFKTALVALDKDATQKAISVAKELSVHMNVHLLFIETDIKTWTTEQINERFRVYST